MSESLKKFIITEADIGRRVRTRCGVEGVIRLMWRDYSYPVEAVLDDVGAHHFTQEGWFLCEECKDEYDLVEFVEYT